MGVHGVEGSSVQHLIFIKVRFFIGLGFSKKISVEPFIGYGLPKE